MSGREKKPIKVKCSYNFERVDIFLRVRGRLPETDDDKITKELLDEYCDKYEKGKLIEGIVPLDYMYKLIKTGAIKTTDEILEELNQNKATP